MRCRQHPLCPDKSCSAQILIHRVDQRHLPAPFAIFTILSTNNPSLPVDSLQLSAGNIFTEHVMRALLWLNDHQRFGFRNNVRFDRLHFGQLVGFLIVCSISRWNNSCERRQVAQDVIVNLNRNQWTAQDQTVARLVKRIVNRQECVTTLASVTFGIS